MDDKELAAEERRLQELLDTRASAAETSGHNTAVPRQQVQQPESGFIT
jgi:hypothetical protein